MVKHREQKCINRKLPCLRESERIKRTNLITKAIAGEVSRRSCVVSFVSLDCSQTNFRFFNQSPKSYIRDCCLSLHSRFPLVLINRSYFDCLFVKSVKTSLTCQPEPILSSNEWRQLTIPPRGTFFSPNFSCMYNIKAISGEVLQLEFTNIQVSNT